MGILLEFFERVKFCSDADRIGPDVPFTHWRLHFKSTMKGLCRRKFKYFDETAEFRPGAYAIGCSNICIGKRVVIRPGTMVFADNTEGGAGITIEDDVLIGSGVHIYVDKHNFDNTEKPIIDQGHHQSEGVILKKGAWVGAGSIILPGVTIGENAVIGAGSVVTRSVPAKVVAAGNPAKVIREIVKSTIGTS